MVKPGLRFVGENLVVQETQFELMLSGTYASNSREYELCHSFLILSPIKDDQMMVQRQAFKLELGHLEAERSLKHYYNINIYGSSPFFC